MVSIKHNIVAHIRDTRQHIDTRTPHPLQTMTGHENAILCLLVVNRLMYSGGAEGLAKCWVTEFGDATRTYRGHRNSVGCLKFDQGTRESATQIGTR